MSDLDGLINLIPIGDIAKKLGIDENVAKAAVAVAVPAIVGGLAANAKTDTGAQKLQAAVEHHDKKVSVDDVDVEEAPPGGVRERSEPERKLGEGLDPVLEQTAVRASRVMGLEVAGVDMIESDTGVQVLEVNASPGLEGIETASGVDVAGAIVTRLEELYRERVDATPPAADPQPR